MGSGCEVQEVMIRHKRTLFRLDYSMFSCRTNKLWNWTASRDTWTSKKRKKSKKFDYKGKRGLCRDIKSEDDSFCVHCHFLRKTPTACTFEFSSQLWSHDSVE